MEQPYTDYDYETFNALYSRFFLTGYYLKNIANEELVNLVGREIRFSSQVIQALHKKTDIPSLAGYNHGRRTGRQAHYRFGQFKTSKNARHRIAGHAFVQ